MSPMEFPPELDLAFYRASNADLRIFSDARLAAHFDEYGRNEGRAGSAAARRDDFIKLVPRAGLVLEIGPWFKPALRGPHVRYFDVWDTETSKRNAASVGGDPADCPDIHYVSPNSDLSMIPERFGAVISSHVIEHQPDFIRHLNAVADLLLDSGWYFLLVPDKRYCFDYFMPVSTIADVLDANIRKRVLHDPRNILEYGLLRTHNEPMRHWEGDHGKPRMAEDFGVVQPAIDEASRYDQGYIDTHAWRLTPEVFRALLNDLRNIGLTNMVPARVYNTVRGSSEFAAILQKM